MRSDRAQSQRARARPVRPSTTFEYKLIRHNKLLTSRSLRSRRSVGRSQSRCFLLAPGLRVRLAS